MKKILQRTACFLFALILSAGMLTADPAAADAAKENNLIYLIEPTELQTAAANTARTYAFTTKTTGPLYADLWFREPTTFSYDLTTSNGTLIDSDTINSNDPDWYSIPSGDNTVYVHGPMYKSSTIGTFTLKVTTYVDTSYLISISQGPSPASLNNTSVSITAGFKHTLKVTNASGKITWKSSNEKVATVNSKGVVTAKNAGSCTIKAVTADKQTLKCKVKCVKNVYTREKYTNADAENDGATAYVYRASVDSSGSLACKVRIINNNSRTITKISNTVIEVKNANGKTVYSYKVKSKSITVPAYSYKDCTIKIPKSKVKNCDLVQATIRMSGSYYYRY